jgi:ornithine cyclodeaminase/alanine dehydrogenase-like protein (mu-crystallin family)
MALIGSGRLAMGLLEGICLARDVEEIQVYSRTAANRERFADEAAAHLSRRVVAAPSVRQAAADADLVLVATSSNDPVLAASDLPENVLVVSIGPRSELYEDVFRQASRIIVTSRVQELDVPDAGDHLPLVRLISTGVPRREDLVELGDVVTSKLTSPPGLVLFREAQGGFSDIALAAQVCFGSAIGDVLQPDFANLKYNARVYPFLIFSEVNTLILAYSVAIFGKQIPPDTAYHVAALPDGRPRFVV